MRIADWARNTIAAAKLRFGNRPASSARMRRMSRIAYAPGLVVPVTSDVTSTAVDSQLLFF